MTPAGGDPGEGGQGSQTGRGLKVLQLASGDGWGGAERVLSLIVQQMQTLRSVETEALLLNEGQLAATLRALDVPVQVVPEAAHSFPRLCLETWRVVRARGIHVVHAHRYKELLLAVIGARLAGRGVVATVHGLEPGAEMGLGRAIVLWAVILLARLLGARFVAVSGEIEERLARRLGRGRVVRIGNPLVEAAADGPLLDLRARAGWPPERPLVGFVGRLERVKGPDLFLALAAAGHGPAGFVVIGSGSMREELERFARARGLEDRVHFVGPVERADPLLRQLDVLVVPSRHEGTPMVVLEAAACGVPVVGFAVGGLPDLLAGHFAARLARPGDVDGLRAAVDALLADPERARRDAARWGASLRERFSASRVVEGYRNLYEATARGRGLPGGVRGSRAPACQELRGSKPGWIRRRRPRRRA
jgi:glycosyltransferase involved in cell wall biosynthesis